MALGMSPACEVKTARVHAMLHYQATYIVSPGTPVTDTSSLTFGYFHLWLHPAQVHLKDYHDACLQLFECGLYQGTLECISLRGLPSLEMKAHPPFRVVVLNLPSAVLHVMVILSLLHGCDVATVMNHNVFSNDLRGPS